MFHIMPFLLTDFYKVGHPFQYPKETTLVYSNLTPRKSRLKGINSVVNFGLQYFIMAYMIEYFNNHFFAQPIEKVLAQYKRRVKNSLGSDLPTYKHLEDLHKLGYLPLEIKAIPEGLAVPIRVPLLTIRNTDADFAWLTNFFESLMSAILWQPITSATIARQYKRILEGYAKQSGMPEDFTYWQGHDFSFRGMSSLESAILSGMGHLTSFYGTDTIPAIDALEKYYGADSDKEIIGGSVPATEHSVMCAGGKESEIETFKRLLNVYPTGILSVVSDTWDLWKVCTEYLPTLKDQILVRDGKLVIRPDSGDPVDIICGHKEHMVDNGRYYALDNRFMKDHEITYPKEIAACKGVLELLWDVFGGTMITGGDGKQYKLLDSHIGAIYGDSITPEVCDEMCKRAMAKGFAPQMVLGIGSFTYQHNTRDTLGMAMKATYVEMEMSGYPDWLSPEAVQPASWTEGFNIFKDPITDDGTKKSAKGLLMVGEDDKGNIYLEDECTWEKESKGLLEPVFRDGKLLRKFTLAEIRRNVRLSK